MRFSVLRFWQFFRSVFRFFCQKTSVFRFWCSFRFADFSFFSIRFSGFVENNSGFSVLLSNVVFGFSYFEHSRHQSLGSYGCACPEALGNSAGVKPKSGYLDPTAHALRANRELENGLVI